MTLRSAVPLMFCSKDAARQPEVNDAFEVEFRRPKFTGQNIWRPGGFRRTRDAAS